jgi:hypothetical protein
MSLVVCFLSFDLSGMGSPTGNYVTAGTALWTTGTLKPPHPAKDVLVKVEKPSRKLP